MMQAIAAVGMINKGKQLKTGPDDKAVVLHEPKKRQESVLALEDQAELE